MPSVEILAELLAAMASADTPRSLVRAIASVLSGHAAIQVVALEGVGDVAEQAGQQIRAGTALPRDGGALLAVAENVDGEWRIVDRVARPVTPIVPGLAIAARGTLPPVLRDPAFRAALAPAIELALNHLRVVRRVADLSRRAHNESRELRADLASRRDPPAIVARSVAMRAVLDRAAAVARHSTTVLVTGESGTGKEVVAREIHRRSSRSQRPFVAINGGAIPESLVESELFGHERGAFTGAERTHVGAFERAHRGTLFLDEIGELSASSQVKLLRALQERQVRRVGGTQQLDVDVRVIAATNRRLDAMVRDGTFREDLFYRLAVFEIVVPPLRERVDDIAPLANAILDAHCRRLGLARRPLSRATVARLEAHAWPGNVRELENVLEAALIVGDGGLMLPAELGRGAARSRAGLDFASASRAAIEAALRATRGKIYGPDGAAARLGLEPSTLQSKMKKLGIRREVFTRRA